MGENKSDKGFTIIDRRIDSEAEAGPGSKNKKKKKAGRGAAAPEGKAPTEAGAGPAPSAPPPEVPVSAPGPAEQKKVIIPGESAPEAPAPPQARSAAMPMNFVTFLLSLHTSALFNLGLIPDPITNQKQVELPLAQQNIDLLEVLQAKTSGNLNEEESKLLENILYELRMLYLQVCEAEGKGECKK